MKYILIFFFLTIVSNAYYAHDCDCLEYLHTNDDGLHSFVIANKDNLLFTYSGSLESLGSPDIQMVNNSCCIQNNQSNTIDLNSPEYKDLMSLSGVLFGFAFTFLFGFAFILIGRG